MATNHELLVSLRRSAQDLTSHRSIRDLDRTLGVIVDAAVTAVATVDAGGISMTENGRVVSRHPTSEQVTKLDRVQSELHEGPCITALDEPPDDGIVVVQDLAGPEGRRWPRFSEYAVDVGYRAMMSTEISTVDGVHAALNLYAAAPDVFDADARLTAGLFGVQAGLLLHGSEQAGQMQRAIDSRDLIGQAKGILIERFEVDAEGAFAMLVQSSQDTNMKVIDVARWLQHEATSGRSTGA